MRSFKPRQFSVFLRLPTCVRVRECAKLVILLALCPYFGTAPSPPCPLLVKTRIGTRIVVTSLHLASVRSIFEDAFRVMPQGSDI